MKGKISSTLFFLLLTLVSTTTALAGNTKDDASAPAKENRKFADYLMCESDFSNDPEGTLLDSGGAGGPYQNDENCSFLIDPGCALFITLNFTTFNTESCCDDLTIYDGADANGVLLGTFQGSTLPSQLVATSGKMYLEWTADFIVTNNGWSADWFSEIPTGPPVAAFSVDNDNPPLNTVVSFTDESTIFPGSWLWNFGDGNTSTARNPQHSYNIPGTYEITLITNNCFDQDTTSQFITVQDSPDITIDPTFINTTINCGDIAEIPLTIMNSGSGDLVYNFSLPGEPVLMESMFTYTQFNNYTNHTFGDIGSGTDSLFLTVTVNGDFDNTIEYASIYIEGVLVGTVGEGSSPLGTDIVETFLFLSPDIDGWLADGTLEVYIENELSVNEDQFTENSHTVMIETQGDFWGVVDIEQGVVGPGTSQVITAILNAEELESGTYNAEFILTTNDPGAQSIVFPILLEVTGEAIPEYSVSCLDFPETMQHTAAELPVVIYNLGCDALVYTNIYSDNNAYTSNHEQLTIPPFSNDTISITLQSDMTGAFSNTLLLESNVSTDSLCLTGNIFGAPIISTDPSSISVALTACGDQVTVPVTISNNGLSELNLAIASGNVDGGLLDSVKQKLNDRFSEVTDLIPNMHEFLNGVTGTSISDGGGDMYDGGNFIRVDNSNALVYSDNAIIQNNDLGVNGQYFTRKFPGLFVFAADINNVDEFSIYGNLGADGSGFVSGAILTSSFQGATYKGFVKRVHGAGDPSVNHLIIVKDYSTLSQNIPTTTDSDDHSILGLAQAERIYYLLFAGASGQLYTDNEMAAIMDAFLDIVGANDLVSFTEETISIPTSDSQTVDMEFITSNTTGGIYEFTVSLNSNDPLNPILEIPVTMDVNFDVCASFAYEQPIECGGERIFSALVTNPVNSYLWDFGDGNTSTLQNPAHVYTATGNYTVILTVVGDNSSSDMVVQTVSIDDVSGPVAACVVQSDFTFPFYDITSFVFNDINNTSSSSQNGYTDFTCEWQTQVVAGESYAVSIIANTFNEEHAQVWIDLNNNGAFESSEKLFEEIDMLGPHEGEITIPSNAVLGVPLRLRVVAEDGFDAVPQACSNVDDGEFEDYTIVIEANTLPPSANFEMTIINDCQGVVEFEDLSSNIPTSWSWDFGDGNQSTLQSPFHTFEIAGTYVVSLTASNEFGSNTTTEAITVASLNPIIQFEGVAEIDSPISFNANTPGATSWSWNFGDGITSSEEVPMHTYTTEGTYTVTVQVSNSSGCTSNASTTISVIFSDTKELPSDLFKVYPVPTESFLSVENVGQKTLSDLRVLDVTGRVVREINLEILPNSIYNLALQGTSPGSYTLILKEESGKLRYSQFVVVR